ncbi:MAG: carboxypeptidase M32 [Bacilli bacterium]|nr:carboxypeptidase M32 [Bacilli bacterium]
MKDFINYLNDINDKKTMLLILMWELDTKVPKDSIDYYSKIYTKIEKEIFEMSTSEKYIELLDKAIASDEYKDLEEHKRLYYLHLKDEYEKNKRIPKEFFEEYSKQKLKSRQSWAEAKDKNDYNIFKDDLAKIINMSKELFGYIYPDSNNVYDDMLSEFERGIKSKDIDPLFEELKKEIIPIIKNLKPIELKDIKQEYNKSELFDISGYLLDYIGFDKDKRELGFYPHGYTSKISKNDCRIAFKETNDIIDVATTIIHEGGHGIFELYCEKDFDELNYVEVPLLALHESQSRFYENILGRNINFWIPIYDDFKKKAKLDFSLDEYMKYFNNAKRSLIRTEADELTYCLHIIIRYEIEREIFNGSIDLNKLPEIWNQKYKEYFDIDVKNDSEGILQDMHWSDASFGYFPDYLLGSIFDGMLLEKINEDLGDVDIILKEGRIGEITDYLNKNIHRYAGSYNIFETCKRVCKKEMNIKPLVNYFKNKYER